MLVGLATVTSTNINRVNTWPVVYGVSVIVPCWVFLLLAAPQSQIGEEGSEVLYVDTHRGHTRSFSSEKIFQDYRAQQMKSILPSAAAAAAPAVPAAALGGAGSSSSPSRQTAAAVAAALASTTGVSAAAAAAGGDQRSSPPKMSSFDEELPDDAPPAPLGVGGLTALSDPLGVS
jgi:hypothetical protein